MHIRYVINQHNCDKLNSIPMWIIKLKNISNFNTLKLVYGFFFSFVTRIKNCLFYHAFTHNTYPKWNIFVTTIHEPQGRNRC